ncbi:two-partner secretion domain-containing protein [Microseira wollei]|uniref:Filamentous haemagglutinin FhaB/tRNA nuclease CdiA-like TPS domain-containing protein n=1 Tax=Microseira wollei NIES-4236 TaxID=2530354 RepID=A0AAV3XMC0_9CYAN|nr:filamentous hemagglutinin N-terminal domain-containing protein [Microseira wollei]GET40677.1 hypothetical protein MiSe_54880 [Microseira wollei NIES-4236]
MFRFGKYMVLYRIGILASCGAIAYTLSLSTTTLAQIIPDNSLGVERSIVTPNVFHPDGLSDRIDGGAIRGSNLFHSFQDFNVGNLQRVYFANPAGIENILGRVTGNQASQILGTLGVLGRANLYLINPNGIIFGKNARLDIPGSFFASTARNLVLENGYQFGTDNPGSPPLLTVNLRPGLGDWLPDSGAIANSGNLSAQQNLTLVGNNLDLQGQLQAGGNLTLQAANNLRVRDSISDAFIAAAGQQLLVQGNKIDIFALNHPASGFFSGQNMTFRSANPIGANAHFYSGGNFNLENINGNRGDLSSDDDPIIRASGDVSFNSYTGASLHIFAGGSVNIDTIQITGTAFTKLLDETVTLSDGVTTVYINGNLEPTVDIRAGTTNFNPPGITGETTGFSAPPNANGTATSANITINRIIAPGGLVFLTNQYQPNPALSGDITVNRVIANVDAAGGGNVVIDSRGRIVTPNILDTSGVDFSTSPPRYISRGGDMTLLAKSDIFMPPSSQIFSYGTVGGNITLRSQSAIIQAPAAAADSFIESATYGAGQGGDVNLNAPTISLSNFVQSNVRRGAPGSGGRLIITANSLQANGAILSNVTRGGNGGNVIINADAISLDRSVVGSETFSSNGGKAGDVEINANTYVATNGGQVRSFTGGIGDAGNVTVSVLDSITLTGTNEAGVFSGFSSDVRPNSIGNAGTITIKTGSLSMAGGAQIRGTTAGRGNAGRIDIEAARSIALDGAILLPTPNRPEPRVITTTIVSEVLPGSQGQGNVIEIKTGQLSVSNGAGISASTVSSGNAGSILINATESVSFDGNPGAPFFPSGAFVGTLAGASGQGGTLTINTPSLSVTNGAQLEAVTESGGNAGNININASESVFLSGAYTGLFSNTTRGSTGNGGNISINHAQIEIRDSAAISVDSKGSGRGGNIEVQANRLTLNNDAKISAETASTDGGNISLALSDLLVLRRESRISTNAGNEAAGGDGGNIRIDSRFVVAFAPENSDITANAFFGRGGNVDINATSIFGLAFQPQLTPFSDITASSQFGVSGTVSLNTPEVDPGSGLLPLPAQVSDPSDQIIVGCAAAEGNSFTITGRGGLPENPTAAITVARSQTVWQDLRDFSSANERANTSPQNPQSSISQSRVQIVEATGWVVNEKGQVELVARLPNGTTVRPGFQFPHCNDLQKMR